MRNIPNVEKHPYLKGRYIGYNKNGLAYGIRKDEAHSKHCQWRAVNTSMSGAHVRTVWAGTLGALAAKLGEVA